MQSFLQEALCQQFWHEQGCPLFDVVHPAFPLPTTVWPTRRAALGNGLREAVVACYMPEPRKFPSLDSCHKRFPWTHTHTEIDVASHPVVGLVLQVGDVEKFLQAFGFEGLDPFLRVSKQGPCFTAIEEGGGDKRLVELELACKADGTAPPDTA